jgi:hypothetical protein
MPLQIRRGLNAERTQITPTDGLVEGELLYVTDQKKLYIGTGSVGEHQGVSITGYTDNDAKDAAAEIFADGEHTGISFTYDDQTKALNAVVDVSAISGPLVADALQGSVFADDSSLLVDAIDKRFFGNLTGNVTGNVLGNLAGNVTGNVTGDVTGNVTGNVTGDVTGNVNGDLTGSVFSDSSTMLVDGTNGVVVGPVVNDSIITNTLSVNSVQSNINTNFRLVFNQQDGTTSSVFIEKNSNDNTNPSTLTFQKSRGVPATPTSVAALDRLGALNFRGFDGTGYLTASQIRIEVSGPVTTNSIPSATVFSNTDSTGTFLESARLDHSRGLSVSRTGSSASIASFQSVHDTNIVTATIGFTRARGSLTAPSAILENDSIVDLAFSGRSAPQPAFPTTCAFIRVSADGPVSADVVPGRIEFHTANLLGTLAQKMVLKNDGVLQVNSIEALTSELTITAVSISEFLKLPIYANDTARTASIPTPAQGMVIFMQTGTSPAATNRPQYYDGTAWQNF